MHQFTRFAIVLSALAALAVSPASAANLMRSTGQLTSGGTGGGGTAQHINPSAVGSHEITGAFVKIN